MGIRKYAVISVILLIFVFFAAAAHAAEPRAYYLAEGNYDEDAKTYTVDVYLDTKVYLAVGTFGMEFGENVKNVTWNSDTTTGKNVGFMQIDTDNFEILETKLFKDNRSTFKEKRQIVVQWGLNKTDISAPIKLGSFTINDVTPEEAESWGNAPFTLLDWSTTNLANKDVFRQKDENDGYGKSLNDEIWRSTTETEKAELGKKAPAGYYQGCAYNDGEEWIDIGFKFTSNLDKEILLTGTVHAYNPNNDIQVAAYNNESVYEGEITGREIYPDGKVTYTYEIPVKRTGSYNIVIQKSVHLTYSEQITVPEDTADEYKIEKEVTLICGDINGDGYVKYPDRAELILFLNRQQAWTENVSLFNKADLNGDKLVNLFDLNILKANIDKTY